jgi:small-conductance mechanosensitive channel
MRRFSNLAAIALLRAPVPFPPSEPAPRSPIAARALSAPVGVEPFRYCPELPSSDSLSLLGGMLPIRVLEGCKMSTDGSGASRAAGDVHGTVEQIGLRSTRIRTGDNIHIIVPNSSILENQVINWTLNDATVRVKLSVGIAYGSPTRQAEALIRQVLIDHPKIHATPDPILLFSDFGDDALIFEARFWVTVRALMDRLRIESEVRFLIDDAFREANISIAFPQRDVHMDTLRPLDVRIVEPDKLEGSE